MKKFVIIISLIILVLLGFDWLYFHEGVYFDFWKEKEKAEYFTKVEGEEIYIKKDGTFVPYEIRGVNLGSGIPG